MSYKRLIPCIFIDKGNAVKWFRDTEIIAEDPVGLAKYYNDRGADELIVFDLSSTDEEHEASIQIMKKMNREIHIPMTAGGNIKNQDDVKKILYAGAKRALINLSKAEMPEFLVEVSKRFGKESIAVSLNDFDTLFKQQRLIEENASSLIFMHRLDLNSVMNVTDIPCVIVTNTEEEEELLKILKCPGVKGLSGYYVNQMDMDFAAFKEKCMREDIKMSSFESLMPFSEFKKDENGLIPVITQDYKTGEVLMFSYMDEEAFENTIRTGKMTYYNRDKNEMWVKGEVSGEYQYIKALNVDCDKSTLLAKVKQAGNACRAAESASCFRTPLFEMDFRDENLLGVLECVYETILDRKKNPKEGSYTNYLLDKGIDKILKKIGEGATEIVIAAKNPNPDEVKYEIADFLYHAMVLMAERGVTWEDVIQELADR